MIKIDNLLDIRKHTDNIRAFVFDLDDTLYGEEEYVKSGYREIAGYIKNVQDAEKKLWKYFKQGKNAIDELLISEGMYKDDLKMKCLSIYREHIPDIHLYDGVYETLETLKKMDYKLGIITDGRPEGQRAKIKALELDVLVDHIIVTDELGGAEYRKPNKAAFELMRDRLGVDFCEMVYVGDNPQKDFYISDIYPITTVRYLNNSLYKDTLYLKGVTEHFRLKTFSCDPGPF